ncbi:hypothetical protein HLB44_01250 [Aquincola sp. S2]|uniref:Uncharacterized protein n=1 Tax=Pseudaquabacterium terrae TaxID=2732868 RepID=A0ABX2E9D1_9BURK|nr:hypothetical protein [Aquabacterium terrae]NRF65600.1 hypothetical protein [Aquabacterium terrae]
MREGLPRPPTGSSRPTVPLPEPPLAGRYRPFSPRQRLRLIGGTIAFVILLWLLLIFQPGRKGPRALPPRPDVANCPPGQASGCAGALAQVRLVPAASAPAGIAASR